MSWSVCSISSAQLVQAASCGGGGVGRQRAALGAAGEDQVLVEQACGGEDSQWPLDRAVTMAAAGGHSSLIGSGPTRGGSAVGVVGSA